MSCDYCSLEYLQVVYTILITWRKNYIFFSIDLSYEFIEMKIESFQYIVVILPYIDIILHLI